MTTRGNFLVQDYYNLEGENGVSLLYRITVTFPGKSCLKLQFSEVEGPETVRQDYGNAQFVANLSRSPSYPPSLSFVKMKMT